MRPTIYFDNSATTKPCDEAVHAANRCLTECWANPSSLYDLGVLAEIQIVEAKKAIAAFIRCRDEELFFFGSGTEANNTAIFGAVKAREKQGNHIVTTELEHPSVLEPIKVLEERGFDVIRLKPDKDGTITIEQFAKAITDKTCLVSTMLVNNEVGSIQPVAEIKRMIKEKNSPALLHCDCVQAFGKLSVDCGALGVDLLTASAHKVHGPKGIGVLYKNKSVHIPPMLYGGGQEKGLRSGTEAVPLIAGFGAAVMALPSVKTELEKIKQLNFYARKALLNTGIVTINSSQDALPYILNISVVGYRSETLLHFLEAKGIYVSSGSACSKGKGSYVLRAMGLASDLIDSALRISFSRYNTEQEIDCLAEAITLAAATLRSSKRK